MNLYDCACVILSSISKSHERRSSIRISPTRSARVSNMNYRRSARPTSHAYLHDCSDCFRLERLPGGTCTHWKAPPFHGAHPLPDVALHVVETKAVGFKRAHGRRLFVAPLTAAITTVGIAGTNRVTPRKVGCRPRPRGVFEFGLRQQAVVVGACDPVEPVHIRLGIIPADINPRPYPTAPARIARQVAVAAA